MALWAAEHADGNVVLWYVENGAPPKKCGEGPLSLEPDLFVWVIETSAPLDIIRFPGRAVVVRQSGKPRV